MSWPSSRQGNKSKGHKSRIANFNSPQIWLPSHLSAWPDVRMPKSPSSALKAKSGTKPNGVEKVRSATYKGPQQSQQKHDSQKQGAIPNTAKKPTLSLSDDEEDKSTATASSEESQQQPADEDSFSKTRSGSNLTRKKDELSSGSDCELTDDEDSNGKASGSQPTLEDGASERKEELKDATASQKKDKTTGRKKNKDRGGSENVFNARSPQKEILGTVNKGDTSTSAQFHKRNDRKVSPVTDFLNSLEEALGPQNQSLDTSAVQSPAKLRTTLDENGTTTNVPIRSRSGELSHNEQTASPAPTTSQRARDFSVAYTEAQRQAKILSRRGHREFSSKAFESSDEEAGTCKTAEKPQVSTKRKKKDKHTVTSHNSVEAEIVKQQARLKEHTAKKMKENPERYLKKDDDKVYELTSDDESDTNTNVQGTDTGVNGRARDGSAPSPSSRENDIDQSITKKDKKRKRKRDRRSDEAEGRQEKRRRPNKDIDNQEPQNEDEATAMIDDFLGNLETMATALTHGMKKKISLARKASMKETLTSLQEIDLDDSPPPTALDYHKAKHDAEFSSTLKSLWPMLPKALLYATMRNLNNANRSSLEEKLKLCLRGKQTNPNIRVVKRVDQHGEDIDLLDEYGIISEPDPHTMSSDLTLLTAARSLIVLLSGQRTGLDLSAIVEKAIEGKDDLLPGDLKQNTKQNPGGVSPMEEQLRRIASERQKEVEKLKEENRVLMARLRRSK